MTPPAAGGASRRIRARFSRGALPADLADEILVAYDRLGARLGARLVARRGQPEVAVRSSATAEGLPGMSFAGQQDTFLNVVGGEPPANGPTYLLNGSSGEVRLLDAGEG